MPERATMPVLRPATMADADDLLAWRNDPETQRQSKTPGAVDRDGHMAWLENVLADPGRRLYVAEADGVAVGSVRADKVEDHWLLSWIVAPAGRGKGYGTAIVAAMIDALDGEIRAEVKPGNIASLRIAEAVGMRMISESDDLTLWAMNK